MAEEAISVGVDTAKRTLDVAHGNSKNARQFENPHDCITSTIRFIVELKPSKIIAEATCNYDMTLTAALKLILMWGAPHRSGLQYNMWYNYWG